MRIYKFGCSSFIYVVDMEHLLVGRRPNGPVAVWDRVGVRGDRNGEILQSKNDLPHNRELGSKKMCFTKFVELMPLTKLMHSLVCSEYDSGYY